MGLAVFNGQIYPIWAGNLNKGHIVNGAVQGPFLSIFYQPMVIADGPRIVSSIDGPDLARRGDEWLGQLHRHL